MKIRCNISKGKHGKKAGCGKVNDYTGDFICEWREIEPWGYHLCCSFCGYQRVLLETLLAQGFLEIFDAPEEYKQLEEPNELDKG